MVIIGMTLFSQKISRDAVRIFDKRLSIQGNVEMITFKIRRKTLKI